MNEAPARVPNLTIGPIETRITAEHVAAYGRAASSDGASPRPGEVPATFPAVWLWHPLAQAAIAETAADGRVPVLTAQRFAYRRKLVVGAAYSFEIQRFADALDPDSFLIEAQVFAAGGEVVATFSATYRLFQGLADVGRP